MPEKPGRNDACYCGSGKKYKKCHLQADEESERKALAEKAAESLAKLKADQEKTEAEAKKAGEPAKEGEKEAPAAAPEKKAKVAGPPKARKAPTGAARQVSAPRKMV
jgi:hypothetical protein